MTERRIPVWIAHDLLRRVADGQLDPTDVIIACAEASALAEMGDAILREERRRTAPR